MLVFAIVAGRALFLAPIHGVADNGDFWRVMHPVGILYEPTAGRYDYVERTFYLAPLQLEKTTTSSIVPAVLARFAADLFGETFDLRILGGLHFLIFVSGLFFLLRSFKSRVLSWGAVWLSLEPNLFLHFNSFFMITMYICLWPWLLWSLRETLLALKRGKEPASEIAWCLAVTGLFIATSKTQFLFVPVFSFLLLRLYAPRKFLFADKLLLVAIAGSVLCIQLYPSGIRRINDYQATFTGIGTVAKNPEQALTKLGVPEDYLGWNGRSLPHALMRGTLPKELNDFVDELSRTRLLGLYLTEPGALQNTFAKIHEALARWPMGYLGHYEPVTGEKRKELRFAWQFSRFRDPILQNAWIVWSILLLALFLFAYKRKDVNAALLGFLALQIVSQFGIVILADGFGAIHRHFIVSRLSFDLLFWLMLAMAYEALSVGKRLSDSEELE